MSSPSRMARRVKSALWMLFQYPVRVFSNVSPTAILVDVQIDKTAALDSRVRLYRSTIGRYSYIGRGSMIESVNIGSFCSIGGDCFVGGGSHPLDRVSTSPVFCAGGNILKKNFSDAPYSPFKRTVIENDVWIGHGVHIASGVCIHTGAVIGMGSIVTKDVGPYEIWAGNPAHLIRKRFNDETITALLDCRWWDWNEEELEVNGRYFINAHDLLEIVNREK